MHDVIRKLILQDCPNYDFDRHRFEHGDVVELSDGAVIVVTLSALDYVDGYIHKRSFRYPSYEKVRVTYDKLPYYNKGEFTPYKYKIQKKLKWLVGDIVCDPTYGTIGILYEETGHQKFYMYVLETNNSYYLHTGIYIQNPYADYINMRTATL